MKTATTPTTDLSDIKNELNSSDLSSISASDQNSQSDSQNNLTDSNPTNNSSSQTSAESSSSRNSANSNNESSDVDESTLSESVAQSTAPSESNDETEITVEAKSLPKKSKSQDANPIVEEIDKLVEDLKNALEDGQLKESISLFGKCQAKLQILLDLNFESQKLKKLKRKISAMNFQLRELKDWRHWGTEQVRLDLIQKLENFRNYRGDPRQLHSQLKDIRELWISWNQSGDYPNRTLREKFASAFEEAFKPCKKYFKDQKAQRKDNKNVRKQICLHLEEQFALTDWARPDWVGVNKLIGNARRQWKNAVPLNKKDWKSTNAQFDDVMEKFEPYIERERQRGVQFRMDLIEKVEALDSLPVKVAIERVKEYQQNWKTVVIRDRKRKENQMWENFHGACDRQFQRRNEIRKAVEEKKYESTKTKQALLDEMQKLNKLPAEEFKASASKATEIQKKWSNTTRASRQAKSGLDTKFNHEVSKFQRSTRNLNNIAFEASLAVLESKSKLCQELELNTGKENCDSMLKTYKKKWNSFEENCGEFEEAIQNRFSTVCTLVQNDGNSMIYSSIWAENLNIKQIICLQLEILSKIDSPPEFAQERMRQNVARLNAAMTKQMSEVDPEVETRELLVNFWLTGAVPPEAHESLNQRFDRIRSKLSKSS